MNGYYRSEIKGGSVSHRPLVLTTCSISQLALEEHPNSKLNVARKEYRAGACERAEVCIVGLPNTIELVSLQRGDIER
jgi:hypothetical protein